MKAETLLRENTRFDRGGSPVEVVIPYKQFIDFLEEHGLDLTAKEMQELMEAVQDSSSGNHSAFVPSHMV